MISENIYWRPGIGDPDFMGWLITVCYFISAAMCMVVARSAKTNHNQGSRFWWFLFTALIFLGFNKQLDLQTLLTSTGRAMAKEGGWYKDRRIVQLGFCIGLTLAGAGTLGAVVWVLRKRLSHFRLAICGLAFLVVFILLRATSFHHFDMLLRKRIVGVKLYSLLELSGIACIGLAALRSGKEFFFGKIRVHGTE